jgi:hypothetical protein
VRHEKPCDEPNVFVAFVTNQEHVAVDHRPQHSPVLSIVLREQRVFSPVEISETSELFQQPLDVVWFGLPNIHKQKINLLATKNNYGPWGNTFGNTTG